MASARRGEQVSPYRRARRRRTLTVLVACVVLLGLIIGLTLAAMIRLP